MRLIQDPLGSIAFTHDISELDSISARSLTRLQHIYQEATNEGSKHLAQLEPRHNQHCPQSESHAYIDVTGVKQLNATLQADNRENLPSVSRDPTTHTETALLARQTCVLCLVHFWERDAVERRKLYRKEAKAVIEKWAVEECGPSGSVSQQATVES